MTKHIQIIPNSFRFDNNMYNGLYDLSTQILSKHKDILYTLWNEKTSRQFYMVFLDNE